MSKFLDIPVIGIDVSADFSFVAILAPKGAVYRKAFRINHDAEGFDYLLKETKKMEEECSMKPVLFMESTGVYHLTLFHFLKMNNLEAYVINPLVTNSNKNSGIRKVKNDKKDALSIANIGKYQDIKMSDFLDINIFAIKSLSRDYYNLVDTRSGYKKKLSSDLRTLFPGYHTVFTDITGVTSLSILYEFRTPKAIIQAPKDELITILKQSSRRCMLWCENTYNKLLKAAQNAIRIGFDTDLFEVTVSINLDLIETFNKQIKRVLLQLENQIKSSDTSKSFRDNVALLITFCGIGFITAITLISEIGDPKRFKHPKQLVAFFGIDPSVNESGKFKGDRNKMSKRGTRFGRRALYAVALASIRKCKNGKLVNSVLYGYYHDNLKGKKKKVALGAVMHKLVKYIFAVLREQKPYEIRDPRLHDQMYLKNASGKVA